MKASPGLKGAVKDAVEAIAGAIAPKSVSQRKPKVDLAVSDAERLRGAQTTDSNNP
jgi:hypothetical protein